MGHRAKGQGVRITYLSLPCVREGAAKPVSIDAGIAQASTLRWLTFLRVLGLFYDEWLHP